MRERRRWKVTRVCPYLFVVIRSYDKILCGFWWEWVDSDLSFPATRSLRCSVCCTSVCLEPFRMERQLARAAHPPCKTLKKHCRRGFGTPVARCSERRLSQFSAYHEQARREIVRTFGQVQKVAHADAHNVVCTTCERCSELLTHVFRAGTGQQDNTRPPLNVFVAEGEDSCRGSVNH